MNAEQIVSKIFELDAQYQGGIIKAKNRVDFIRTHLCPIVEPVARISTLFDAIAHGSQEHRVWLKEAITNHFAGIPVEKPRS